MGFFREAPGFLFYSNKAKQIWLKHSGTGTKQDLKFLYVLQPSFIVSGGEALKKKNLHELHRTN